jgi:hypothetical protein
MTVLVFGALRSSDTVGSSTVVPSSDLMMRF